MSIIIQDYVIALSERIRNHLRDAFNLNTLITTTENIAKYICNSLENVELSRNVQSENTQNLG